MSAQTWTNVIALSGSAVALLGVVLGGLMAARAQSRHWRFSEQAEACAAFLAAYARVYLAYAEAAQTGAARAAQHTSDFVDWSEFGKALETLNILVDREIADAAHEWTHSYGRSDASC